MNYLTYYLPFGGQSPTDLTIAQQNAEVIKGGVVPLNLTAFGTPTYSGKDTSRSNLISMSRAIKDTFKMKHGEWQQNYEGLKKLESIPHDRLGLAVDNLKTNQLMLRSFAKFVKTVEKDHPEKVEANAKLKKIYERAVEQFGQHYQDLTHLAKIAKSDVTVGNITFIVGQSGTN